MGACCANDIRGKKLDTKEAQLDPHDDAQVADRTAKPQLDALSDEAENSPFEDEAKKLRSSNEHVNVGLFCGFVPGGYEKTRQCTMKMDLTILATKKCTRMGPGWRQRGSSENHKKLKMATFIMDFGMC